MMPENMVVARNGMGSLLSNTSIQKVAFGCHNICGFLRLHLAIEIADGSIFDTQVQAALVSSMHADEQLCQLSADLCIRP